MDDQPTPSRSILPLFFALILQQPESKWESNTQKWQVQVDDQSTPSRSILPLFFALILQQPEIKSGRATLKNGRYRWMINQHHPDQYFLCFLLSSCNSLKASGRATLKNGRYRWMINQHHPDQYYLVFCSHSKCGSLISMCRCILI